MEIYIPDFLRDKVECGAAMTRGPSHDRGRLSRVRHPIAGGTGGGPKDRATGDRGGQDAQQTVACKTMCHGVWTAEAGGGPGQ